MRRSTRSKSENLRVARAAQSVGAAFEAWIDAQHEAAIAMGLLGHVEHNQARAQVIGGRIVYTACGYADYTLLLPGAVYGAVEAKSTSDSALMKSEVKAKQAAHLDVVVRVGGVALLLVEFRHDDGPSRRYSIPWDGVPWKVKRSALSVDEADVEKFVVPVGSCYLGLRAGAERLVLESKTIRRFPRE